MNKNVDEDFPLKDILEDVPNEGTQTLFSPKTSFSADDNELDEQGFDNAIPAVLLSPCSRRTSVSEQGLKRACSGELLVPPSPFIVPKNIPLTDLEEDRKQTWCIFPRDLSLSLPLTSANSSTDIRCDSGYSGEFLSSPTRGDVEEQPCEGDGYLFANHAGCRMAPLRASIASLGVQSPHEVNDRKIEELPLAASAPNLHQDRTAGCRRPSAQLCCILRTNYTTLSTPASSECSSPFSNQSSEDNSDEKGELIFPNVEFNCSIGDESDLPLLTATDAPTPKTSSTVVKDPMTFFSPKEKNRCKQLSTPNLSLGEKCVSQSLNWKRSKKSLVFVNDSLADKNVSSRLNTVDARSNMSSSAFLHPDSARCSFEESAAPSLHASCSNLSAYQKRRAFSRSRRPKLEHQSLSLQSSASSAVEESSNKSDTSSVIRSFLSLISPSRLLAKLSSSKHSVRSTDSRASRQKRQHIDCPEDTKIVTLNVSGRCFKINEYFLSIYPSTLLGSKAILYYYDRVRNEFFFDRDPDCFRYIWNFYHSGELHCPREECLQSFLDEVAFFGLDVSMLCNCCWQETFEPAYEKLTKRKAEQEAADKEATEATHLLRPDAAFREKVWITLQEPSFSLIAKLFYLLSVFVIAISVVANTAETIACEGTIRICKEENEETYFNIDTACVAFFTFEYVARLMVCPRRLRFFISVMSIVDVLAILPYYINLLLEYLSVGASSGMEAFVVLRVLRTLRVFKLLRHSKRLKKLLQSMRDSATELGLIGFVYMVMVILFSSIIYFAELSEDTQFTSIPQAMWYAVITSTTAG